MTRAFRAAAWLCVLFAFTACNDHLGFWTAKKMPVEKPITLPDDADHENIEVDASIPLPPPSARPDPDDAILRCGRPAEAPCALPGDAVLPDEASAVEPGIIDWFASGVPLPAGRYRVEYVDGCMTYDLPGVPRVFGWSVHTAISESVLGIGAVWLITDADLLVVLAPGTRGTTPAEGAFATYLECVTANCSVPPLEFDFLGGRLGIRYGAGFPLTYVSGAAEGGSAPTFRLTSVDPCR